MPKKAVKKTLEEFSPLSQRLLKLRNSDKTEWTESSSDSSKSSLNSSEENKLLEQLVYELQMKYVAKSKSGASPAGQ